MTRPEEAKRKEIAARYRRLRRPFYSKRRKMTAAAADTAGARRRAAERAVAGAAPAFLHRDACSSREAQRDLIEEVIQQHLPPEQFAVLKAAEESERKLIAGLVERIGGGHAEDR
jgi:hypothetical protein